MTKLRTQAAKCNYNVTSVTRQMTVEGVTNPVEVPIEFHDLTDELIRDRIVVGVLDKGTRGRLLREKSLTLKTAIGIVRSQELADEQIQTLCGKIDNPEINVVKKKKSKTKKPQSKDKEEVKTQKKKKKLCKYCATSHERGECPAYGKQCSYCQRKHHTEAVCYKKRNDAQKSIEAVEDEDSEETDTSNEYSDDDDVSNIIEDVSIPGVFLVLLLRMRIFLQ